MEDWTVSDMIDVDFDMFIDRDKIVTGVYFEEDAFEIVDSLLQPVRKWFDDNISGNWGGFGFASNCMAKVLLSARMMQLYFV